MLKKIRNFFSRRKNDGEEQKDPSSRDKDVLGSITYYFKASDDNTYMDVQLNDYEEKTVDQFAKIISGLSSIRFQLETLSMIKECFMGVDEERIFNQIVVKMIEYTDNEAGIIEKINQGNQSKEEQPWIKPSEMIK